jgi:hypothetical protein
MSNRLISQTNTTQQKGLETLTIFEILKELKPTHIWTIISVIGISLSAAFTIGYYLKSNTAAAEVKTVEAIAESKAANQQKDYEGKIRELENKLNLLAPTAERFGLLQAKEQYLSFLARYLQAKEVANDFQDEESMNNMNRELSKLAQFVEEQIAKSRSLSDEQAFKAAIFIGRAETLKDVKIKFGYDNTVWPVPPDILPLAPIISATGEPPGGKRRP